MIFFLRIATYNKKPSLVTKVEASIGKKPGKNQVRLGKRNLLLTGGPLFFLERMNGMCFIQFS